MRRDVQCSTRTRLSLLGLALLLAGTVSWGVVVALAAGSSTSPPSKVVLRVGWIVDPVSMNPFVGQEGTAMEVYSLNYDFLTGYDAATLSPKPRLAESWSHSADGSVWTFNLRQGVKWHDGQPFTAADVAFTYTYIMENELGAFTPFTTFIERVVAVDDHTVRFFCSRPKANMLSLIVPILPQHIWSKIDPDVAGNTYNNQPPVIGTGPFQVVEYKPGRYVRLTANKDYWGGAPRIDEIIYQIYQNADTIADDLRSGAIQVARDLTPALLKSLATDPDLATCHSTQNQRVHDLGFNCYPGVASQGHPALRDPAFRRALNCAVDKVKICDVAYLGMAKPGETVIVSDYYKDPDWCWTPAEGERYKFDLDRARAELDAAGYRDTDGDGVRDYRGKPITLRLWAIRGEHDRQAAGKLITGWLRQIGLRIKFEVLDEGAIMDRMWNKEGDTFAPDYDMFLWGWAGDPDPNFILSVFTSDQIGSWSDTNWSNEEYDRLFEEQQSTLDPTKRQEIIHEMQRIMYRETPMIFFAEPGQMTAWNVADWEGWVRSPAETGHVINTRTVIDSYLYVHPRPAPAAAESWAPKAPLLVAGAVCAGVAVGWVIRRRRAPAVEEAG